MLVILFYSSFIWHMQHSTHSGIRVRSIMFRYYETYSLNSFKDIDNLREIIIMSKNLDFCTPIPQRPETHMGLCFRDAYVLFQNVII